MIEPVVEKAGCRWLMTGEGNELTRSEFDLSPPAAGNALVRVAGCGVCHTDVGFLYDNVMPRAALPLALGHEISGEVVAAAPGFERLVGKAVIVPAVTPCGTCPECLSGFGQICPDQKMPGNDLHGGFASHVQVPAHGLCVVDAPGALQGEELGKSRCTLAELSVIADAVTTPLQAIRRARVGPGDFVVVIGLGGVGGFAAQIASAFGATVVGFDVDEQKLDRMTRYGLDAGFNSLAVTTPKEARNAVRSVARDRDHRLNRWKIFECSGTAPGQETAWGLLVPGAYLSVVGYTMDKVEVRISNLMAFNAKVCGNWGCLPELYPEALVLALDGRVEIKPFIETFPMNAVAEVLRDVHAHRLANRAVLINEEEKDS